MKPLSNSSRFFCVFAFALLLLFSATGCGESGNSVVEQTPTEQTEEDFEEYDKELTQPGGV